MSDLTTAITIAAKFHEFQRYADGLYIFHPLRVMLKMETDEERIVAILHDTMEDCGVTATLLEILGFSDEIIEAVKLLTKSPHQDYHTYLHRLMKNPLAYKVKCGDLQENMDNLNSIGNEEKREKLRVKYLKAREILKMVYNAKEADRDSM